MQLAQRYELLIEVRTGRAVSAQRGYLFPIHMKTPYRLALACTQWDSHSDPKSLSEVSQDIVD